MFGRVFSWNLFITRPFQTLTTPIKPALDTSPTVMHRVTLRMESHQDHLECHVPFMLFSCRSFRAIFLLNVFDQLF